LIFRGHRFRFELETIIRQGDKACIDRFFAHARKKARGVRVPRQSDPYQCQGGRLQGRQSQSWMPIGRANTARWSSDGGEWTRKVFTGSVSRYLINQFSDGARFGWFPDAHPGQLAINHRYLFHLGEDVSDASDWMDGLRRSGPLPDSAVAQLSSSIQVFSNSRMPRW
jgi:hypothetical protein